MDEHGLPEITEVKETVDGRAQAFRCGLLEATPARAVVLFVVEREVRGDRYTFPAGSRTYGFFWANRPYNCYRMHGPDGALVAHRFDVVDEVRVTPDAVRYRDLLLDVWVDPDGTIRVEDEDEVAAAREAGLLTAAQLRRIQQTRDFLLANHARVMDEVAAVLSGLGVR